MRTLTKEELDFIKQTDPNSITRIPVIHPVYDYGFHRYDPTQQMGEGKRSIINNIVEKTDLSKDSLTVVFSNNFDIVLSAATIYTGTPMSREERKRTGAEYPASLRDLLRIAIMSGATKMELIFNHPTLEWKVIPPFTSSKKIKEKYLNYFDDDLMMCCACVLIPTEVKMFGSYEYEKDLGCVGSIAGEDGFGEKTYAEIFTNTFNQYAVSTGLDDPPKSEKTLELNRPIDFSFNGQFPGMDKTHLDRWEFWLSKDQIKPIRYEQWQRKEIEWSVDQLIDLANYEEGLKRSSLNEVNKENIQNVMQQKQQKTQDSSEDEKNLTVYNVNFKTPEKQIRAKDMVASILLNKHLSVPEMTDEDYYEITEASGEKTDSGGDEIT